MSARQAIVRRVTSITSHHHFRTFPPQPTPRNQNNALTYTIQSGQRHILRALSQWPKDTIRPEVQFQEVLIKRFEQPRLNMSEEEQLKQANALYSLLDNRYKKTVRKGSCSAPDSLEILKLLC
jgi:hypothetical protein